MKCFAIAKVGCIDASTKSPTMGAAKRLPLGASTPRLSDSTNSLLSRWIESSELDGYRLCLAHQPAPSRECRHGTGRSQAVAHWAIRVFANVVTPLFPVFPPMSSQISITLFRATRQPRCPSSEVPHLAARLAISFSGPATWDVCNGSILEPPSTYDPRRWAAIQQKYSLAKDGFCRCRFWLDCHLGPDELRHRRRRPDGSAAGVVEDFLVHCARPRAPALRERPRTGGPSPVLQHAER